MIPIRFITLSGLRDILILFLGLNLAWIELSVDIIMISGPSHQLGWPPFDWYISAVEWFWIHFVLSILSVATLLYINQVQVKNLREKIAQNGGEP